LDDGSLERIVIHDVNEPKKNKGMERDFIPF
jgi:hypothetical protein